ncbi:type II toxin-antitoxin system death-on-curing family toxin [soil metagenome]
MKILGLEDLLQLHALVIEATGGGSGLRDLGRLESAIASQTQNVFGSDLFPSIPEKAAALIRSIVADHAFIDGNKRTAMLAGLTLLEINNISFNAKKGEIEDFAVRIANEKLDVPVIAEWLKNHVN